MRLLGGWHTLSLTDGFLGLATHKRRHATPLVASEWTPAVSNPFTAPLDIDRLAQVRTGIVVSELDATKWADLVRRRVTTPWREAGILLANGTRR